MKFCDNYCCFPSETCEKFGKTSLNPSGYHKVCDDHLISIKNVIECVYCKSIVMSTFGQSRSPLISQENEEEIMYCTACFDIHLPGYHTKIKCLKCENYISRNENICNHTQCESCSYFYCAECLSTDFSCRLKDYYLLKCGHLTCEHIYDSNIILYTPEDENNVCSKCNIPSYIFRAYTSSTNYNQNFYCWRCINSNDSIVSQDMESSREYAAIGNRQCPNCGNYSEYCELECSHEGCLHCCNDNSCKKCLSKKNKCINCEEKCQRLCLFECDHPACFDCIHKTCNECNPKKEKKECSRCKKPSFICRPCPGSNFGCEHDTCFSCISVNKDCRTCKSDSKEFSYQSEKKNTLVTPHLPSNEEEKRSKEFSVNHNRKFQTKGPGHFYRNCDKCRSTLNLNEDLSCGHVICEKCLKSNLIRTCPMECSLRICNFCKSMDICRREGNKDEYICRVCISNNDNYSVCYKCGHKFDLKRLKCGHVICERCYQPQCDECLDCMKKEQYCFICYTKNFEKIVSDCGHISCTNCNRDSNKHCLNCSFKNPNLPKYKIISRRLCAKCETRILSGFELLCNHYICRDCIKPDWKYLNFRCESCYLGRKCDEIFFPISKGINFK